MWSKTVNYVEIRNGKDRISVEKSGGEAGKPENSISVESQPELMPIAAIDRIMLTDTREI